MNIIAQYLRSDMHRFGGKTILITGAAGFLGRHFIEFFRDLNAHYLNNPCTVLAVDNYITGAVPLEAGYGITPLWADVTQPLPLRAPVHFIISAAGIASPVYYRKFPLETIDATVAGTRNLLELARKQNNLEAFLYFSSSEVYGDPDHSNIPTTESYNGNVSCTGPRACYDESKRLGETLCSIYAEKFKLPVKVVRPFNVFGPGMSYADRRVVPMYTLEALHGRPLPIFLGGTQTRTFCYITDAMVGFLKVLLEGHYGEAYNIGTQDNEIAMRDLGAMFQKLIRGTKLSFVPYPDGYPASEPLRRCPDISKAWEHVGYAPSVGLQEGLAAFITWARHDPGYR